MDLKSISCMLSLGLAMGSGPRLVEAQTSPERGGVEVGLSMSSFPEWNVTSHYADGVLAVQPFRRQTLWGITAAVFPHRYVGIRGRVETSGLRYYSEDSGFDLWRLGLEGRFVRFGPITVISNLDVGRISQTNGFLMRFWGFGGGLVLRLSNAFVLSARADLLWNTAGGNRSMLVERSEIDFSTLAPRIDLTWRPLRFGL